MQQQGKPTIRTIDQALSDVRRGESRRRRQATKDAAQKYDDSAKEMLRRYNNDRDALLDEYTWTCPYCGKTLEPIVHHVPAVEPLNQWSRPIPAKVSVHRRQKCGCASEVYVLAQCEDEDDIASTIQRNSQLSKAGLVGWLASATFDAYIVETEQQERQKRLALEYATALLGGGLGDQCWLILYGPLGTGKTHLAAAIVHTALEAGRDGCYLRVWPQWIETLQASWDKDSGLSTAALIRELQGGKLAVIDDIDKAKTTEWMKEKLYTALNERYNRRLPTVLTFNRSPGEMVPWLGGPLIDRLIEVQYNVVQFAGQSYRSPLDLPY